MKSRSKARQPVAKIVCAKLKLELAVQYATSISDLLKEFPTRSQFRKWIKIALTLDARITLRIVDEAEGCRLNQNFCGKDYATNVLAFSYNTSQPLFADIVLCASVIDKEAKQQCKSLMAHYAHLVIHGALHLQGYDHESDDNAKIMEQLETKTLKKLGYDDPYKESQKQGEC